MRRRILVGVVGALLLGTLLVVPSALGNGGSAKGTEVWWHEGRNDSGPLIKAIFQTTASGIVHEWRYEPENLQLIFKPADKFPKPEEGDYVPWTYKPAVYWIDENSPAGDLTLKAFFVEGALYWLQITEQD